MRLYICLDAHKGSDCIFQGILVFCGHQFPGGMHSQERYTHIHSFQRNVGGNKRCDRSASGCAGTLCKTLAGDLIVLAQLEHGANGFAIPGILLVAVRFNDKALPKDRKCSNITGGCIIGMISVANVNG